MKPIYRYLGLTLYYITAPYSWLVDRTKRPVWLVDHLLTIDEWIATQLAKLAEKCK